MSWLILLTIPILLVVAFKLGFFHTFPLVRIWHYELLIKYVKWMHDGNGYIAPLCDFTKSTRWGSPWYGFLFPAFKDLKEVKKLKHTATYPDHDCSSVWFSLNLERLTFLNRCIDEAEQQLVKRKS